MLPVAAANARGHSFSRRQRSAHRSRFGVGRLGKLRVLDVRRWSRRTAKFTGNAREINHFKNLSSRSPVQFLVIRGFGSISASVSPCDGSTNVSAEIGGRKEIGNAQEVKEVLHQWAFAECKKRPVDNPSDCDEWNDGNQCPKNG